MTDTEVTATSWPEFVQALDRHDGVYPVKMESLRLLEGAQRLAPTVIQAIDERLQLYGVGHIPPTLPVRGNDLVILFRHGSMASEVVRAIQQGLTGAVADTTAKALRALNKPAAETNAIPIAPDVMEKASEAVTALRELLTEASTPDRRR